MQVNMNKPYCNPSFQTAYRIHDAYIDGAHYRHKQQKVLKRAAMALAGSILKDSLSLELKEKVNILFPDLKKFKFMRVARTIEKKPWDNEIIIMSAEDAQQYYNVYQMEKNIETDNCESQWILKRIAKNAWDDKLTIYAKEVNGDLIITDVEKFVKPDRR